MVYPTTPKSRRSYGGNAASGTAQWKRCIVIAAAIFMLVFLMAPGEQDDSYMMRPSPSVRSKDTNNENNGNSIPKSPTIDTAPESLRQPLNLERTAPGELSKGTDEEGLDKAKLDETISKVFEDIDDAEEEDIKANQSMLSKGLKKVEDLFKIGLGKLFGNSIGEEELSQIANEVAERLEDDVQNELKEKADDLADKKVEELNNIVETDEFFRTRSQSIRTDLLQAEVLAVDELKDKIDSVAQEIVDGLKQKAMEIEKEVVNEHLKGKGLHVEVEDGELKKQGDDLSPEITKQVNAVEQPKQIENTTSGENQIEAMEEVTKTENMIEVVRQEEVKNEENSTEVGTFDVVNVKENVTEITREEGGVVDVVAVEEGQMEENKTEEVLLEEDQKEENKTEEMLQEEVQKDENKTEEVVLEEDQKEENTTEEVVLEEDQKEENTTEEVVLEEDQKEENTTEEVVLEEDQKEESKTEEVVLEEVQKEENTTVVEKEEIRIEDNSTDFTTENATVLEVNSTVGVQLGSDDSNETQPEVDERHDVPSEGIEAIEGANKEEEMEKK